MAAQNTALAVNREQAQLGFVSGIDNLVGAVHSMARANIQEFIRQNGDQGFSQLQITAMEKVEALRLVGALDLAGIMARYQIIQEIRQGNYLSTHPSGFRTLDEMAEANNISLTELHNTINLGEHIFPFILREYGENAVADMWDEMGKARFMEMAATLTSAITGQRSGSRNVREAIENAENLAAANAAVEGLNWADLPEEQRRRRRSREVLEIARQAPNIRALRQALRGSRTENIQFLQYAPDAETVVVAARLERDQRSMLSRLLGDHFEVVDLDQTDPGNLEVQNTMRPLLGLLERAEIPETNGGDGDDLPF